MLFVLGLFGPGLHLVTSRHEVRSVDGRLVLTCLAHDHHNDCTGSTDHEHEEEEVEDDGCPLLLVDAQVRPTSALQPYATQPAPPVPTAQPRSMDAARPPPLTFAPKNSPPRTA